ncbi:nascent polypeptide-associated complex subunit alpha, muscle-specific form isoform X1 [Drosophila tropicalis]|uniref:nascent polypeptide-associated complex subunit alpha, muscle-specific form isoform X1 n=1 Tax=Drosophila tropicalis TaxID=46794 RepID=UPI0035ABFE53
MLDIDERLAQLGLLYNQLPREGYLVIRNGGSLKGTSTDDPIWNSSQESIPHTVQSESSQATIGTLVQQESPEVASTPASLKESPSFVRVKSSFLGLEWKVPKMWSRVPGGNNDYYPNSTFLKNPIVTKSVYGLPARPCTALCYNRSKNLSKHRMEEIKIRGRDYDDENNARSCISSCNVPNYCDRNSCGRSSSHYMEYNGFRQAIKKNPIVEKSNSRLINAYSSASVNKKKKKNKIKPVDQVDCECDPAAAPNCECETTKRRDKKNSKRDYDNYAEEAYCQRAITQVCSEPECSRSPKRRTPQSGTGTPRRVCSNCQHVSQSYREPREARGQEPPRSKAKKDRTCSFNVDEPSDYLELGSSRSKHAALKNPLTVNRSEYCEDELLPHESFSDEYVRQRTTFVKQEEPKYRQKTPTRCSNETLMERSLKTYRYSTEHNCRNPSPKPLRKRCPRCNKPRAKPTPCPTCQPKNPPPPPPTAPNCCPMCGLYGMMPRYMLAQMNPCVPPQYMDMTCSCLPKKRTPKKTKPSCSLRAVPKFTPDCSCKTSKATPKPIFKVICRPRPSKDFGRISIPCENLLRNCKRCSGGKGSFDDQCCGNGGTRPRLSCQHRNLQEANQSMQRINQPRQRRNQRSTYRIIPISRPPDPPTPPPSRISRPIPPPSCPFTYLNARVNAKDNPNAARTNQLRTNRPVQRNYTASRLQEHRISAISAASEPPPPTSSHSNEVKSANARDKSTANNANPPFRRTNTISRAPERRPPAPPSARQPQLPSKDLEFEAASSADKTPTPSKDRLKLPNSSADAERITKSPDTVAIATDNADASKTDETIKRAETTVRPPERAPAVANAPSPPKPPTSSTGAPTNANANSNINKNNQPIQRPSQTRRTNTTGRPPAAAPAPRPPNPPISSTGAPANANANLNINKNNQPIQRPSQTRRTNTTGRPPAAAPAPSPPKPPTSSTGAPANANANSNINKNNQPIQRPNQTVRRNNSRPPERPTSVAPASSQALHSSVATKDKPNPNKANQPAPAPRQPIPSNSSPGPSTNPNKPKEPIQANTVSTPPERPPPTASAPPPSPSKPPTAPKDRFDDEIPGSARKTQSKPRFSGMANVNNKDDPYITAPSKAPVKEEPKAKENLTVNQAKQQPITKGPSPAPAPAAAPAPVPTPSQHTSSLRSPRSASANSKDKPTANKPKEPIQANTVSKSQERPPPTASAPPPSPSKPPTSPKDRFDDEIPSSARKTQSKPRFSGMANVNNKDDPYITAPSKAPVKEEPKAKENPNVNEAKQQPITKSPPPAPASAAAPAPVPTPSQHTSSLRSPRSASVNSKDKPTANKPKEPIQQANTVSKRPDPPRQTAATPPPSRPIPPIPSKDHFDNEKPSSPRKTQRKPRFSEMVSANTKDDLNKGKAPANAAVSAKEEPKSKENPNVNKAKQRPITKSPPPAPASTPPPALAPAPAQASAPGQIPAPSYPTSSLRSPATADLNAKDKPKANTPVKSAPSRPLPPTSSRDRLDDDISSSAKKSNTKANPETTAPSKLPATTGVSAQEESKANQAKQRFNTKSPPRAPAPESIPAPTSVQAPSRVPGGAPAATPTPVPATQPTSTQGTPANATENVKDKTKANKTQQPKQPTNQPIQKTKPSEPPERQTSTPSAQNQPLGHTSNAKEYTPKAKESRKAKEIPKTKEDSKGNNTSQTMQRINPKTQPPERLIPWEPEPTRSTTETTRPKRSASPRTWFPTSTNGNARDYQNATAQPAAKSSANTNANAKVEPPENKSASPKAKEPRKAKEPPKAIEIPKAKETSKPKEDSGVNNTSQPLQRINPMYQQPDRPVPSERKPNQHSQLTTPRTYFPASTNANAGDKPKETAQSKVKPPASAKVEPTTTAQRSAKSSENISANANENSKNDKEPPKTKEPPKAKKTPKAKEPSKTKEDSGVNNTSQPILQINPMYQPPDRPVPSERKPNQHSQLTTPRTYFPASTNANAGDKPKETAQSKVKPPASAKVEPTTTAQRSAKSSEYISANANENSKNDKTPKAKEPPKTKQPPKAKETPKAKEPSKTKEDSGVNRTSQPILQINPMYQPPDRPVPSERKPNQHSQLTTPRTYFPASTNANAGDKPKETAQSKVKPPANTNNNATTTAQQSAKSENISANANENSKNDKTHKAKEPPKTKEPPKAKETPKAKEPSKTKEDSGVNNTSQPILQINPMYQPPDRPVPSERKPNQHSQLTTPRTYFPASTNANAGDKPKETAQSKVKPPASAKVEPTTTAQRSAKSSENISVNANENSKNDKTPKAKEPPKTKEPPKAKKTPKAKEPSKTQEDSGVNRTSQPILQINPMYQPPDRPVPSERKPNQHSQLTTPRTYFPASTNANAGDKPKETAQSKVKPPVSAKVEPTTTAQRSAKSSENISANANENSKNDKTPKAKEPPKTKEPPKAKESPKAKKPSKTKEDSGVNRTSQPILQINPMYQPPERPVPSEREPNRHSRFTTSRTYFPAKSPENTSANANESVKAKESPEAKEPSKAKEPPKAKEDSSGNNTKSTGRPPERVISSETAPANANNNANSKPSGKKSRRGSFLQLRSADEQPVPRPQHDQFRSNSNKPMVNRAPPTQPRAMPGSAHSERERERPATRNTTGFIVPGRGPFLRQFHIKSHRIRLKLWNWRKS